MKKAKKVLLLVLCAALLVGASVAGTMAYLTSKDTVTNTFTVGKVVITMDEANVDEYGELADLTRVQENTYKLIPGHKYVKDPTIRVDTESEDCFLFVNVQNWISGIEAETTIHNQMRANGWTLLAGSTDTYYYKDTCAAGSIVPTFANFTIKNTETDLSGYADKNIIVTAYAVQADGFDTAQDAWDASFGAPGNP